MSDAEPDSIALIAASDFPQMIRFAHTVMPVVAIDLSVAMYVLRCYSQDREWGHKAYEYEQLQVHSESRKKRTLLESNFQSISIAVLEHRAADLGKLGLQSNSFATPSRRFV